MEERENATGKRRTALWIGVLLLATVVFPWHPALGAERTAVIAVLDLVPDRNIGLVAPTRDEVHALTEQLRSELAQTGRFTVVEPERIAQALVEAGLEGTECDGEECAARVGRLLGATMVLTGRVIRAMTLIWGVDVRVTDVETGRNLRRQAAEFKGDYLVLKTLGMRQLAREVAGY